jgi:hypothetical protein
MTDDVQGNKAKCSQVISPVSDRGISSPVLVPPFGCRRECSGLDSRAAPRRRGEIMDAITLLCLTEWFVMVGRRLDLLPPARARFVQPPVSNRAERVETQLHNNDSFHVEIMSME